MYATGAEIAGTFTATWGDFTLTIADGSQEFMYVSPSGSTAEDDRIFELAYWGGTAGYFPRFTLRNSNGRSETQIDNAGISTRSYQSGGQGIVSADTGINPGSISFTGPGGQIGLFDFSLAYGRAQVAIEAGSAGGEYGFAEFRATARDNAVALGSDADGHGYLTLNNPRIGVSAVQPGDAFLGDEELGDSVRGYYRPLYIRTR